MKRTPLIRRTSLKRGAPLPRRGWLRRSRQRRPVTPAEWVAFLGPCAVCGSTVNVDSHHIIPRRILRVLGLDLWDLRDRLPLCRRHHERHENRTEPVPRELLPSQVWEFADEVGLTWYLEKHYPARVSA